MMTTNELSDNIGTEFATAVPGALFQVSGRRLSDRRFYVDIVMFPGPECVALPEPVPGVEIISGPEAEELLATVEGWIGTDRVWAAYAAARSGRDPGAVLEGVWEA